MPNSKRKSGLVGLLGGQIFPAMLEQAETADRRAVLRTLLLLVARLMGEARGLVPGVLNGFGEQDGLLTQADTVRACLAEIGVTGQPVEEAVPQAALAGAIASLRGVAWHTADIHLPGDLYADLMTDRRRRGSYYTPALLAQDVARRTLEPLLAGMGRGGLRILDPAMGSGHFLIAAGEVIAAWLAGQQNMPVGDARRRALDGLYGIDRDPVAVELAAISLWLWLDDADSRPADLAGRLLCGDALLDDDLLETLPAPFDAVVGNPPFVSVFARARDRSADAQRSALRARYRTARGSFDLSVPFVERSIGLCRPGGRCGLVLPNKILAADYARALRGWVAERASLEAIVDWSRRLPFDAAVYPVACIFRHGPPRPAAPLEVYRVEEDGGPPMLLRRGTQADLHRAPGEVWSGVFDPAWDVLRGCFEGTVPLGQVATLHAGLTVGEAYDLRPHVFDAPPGQHPPDAYRLVTSRLIRRYRTAWGEEQARYLEQTYQRPMIPAEALPARRRQQAAGRKLIVSGMGRYLRVILDEGTMQASVATTIIADAAWPPGALCAALNSRLASRLYRALFGGLALSGGYLRFTRRELSLLPVPDLPASDPRLARLDALAACRVKADAGEASALDSEIEGLVCELYGLEKTGLAATGEA